MFRANKKILNYDMNIYNIYNIIIIFDDGTFFHFNKYFNYLHIYGKLHDATFSMWYPKVFIVFYRTLKKR